MTAFRKSTYVFLSVGGATHLRAVRRALGYGLVLAVARDGHGPTAARSALQIELPNEILLVSFPHRAGVVRAAACR